MKKILKAYSILIVGLVLVAPFKVEASHALGADITYEYVGPNTYKIITSFYRDCAGIPAPDSVQVSISSASCGSATTQVWLTQGGGCASPTGLCCGQQLPGVCGSSSNLTTCQGGTLPGVQVYTYCGTITLPQACNDWIISYDICCRNNAITNVTNASADDLWVQATINNKNGIAASSPFFTTDPSELFCAGFHYCYNHGAVDPDGDSLVFTLVNPLGASGVPITTYATGLSATTPIATTGNNFTFDQTTGQMCFTPNAAQVDVVSIQVDKYRRIAGVVTLVGSTRRDIQFNILSNGLCSNTQPTPPIAVTPTGGALLDSVTIEMCPNNNLNFTVVSTDSSSVTLTMTSNAISSIPGSTFNITGNGTDTVRGAFSWTPTAANAGINFFTVTVSNNACPVPATSTQTIKIIVFDRVTASASAPSACGDSIQLGAIGGSVFHWTPTAGLSNPNIANPKALPSVRTKYTVTSDCGSDTITVGVGTPFTLNITKDTTICLNGSVQLNATPVGGGAGTTFIYKWTPASPVSLISNPAIANPTVSPTATTTFSLQVQSSQGCIKDTTVKVTISGRAPSVTANATPDTICPGGTVQLQLSASPSTCGISTNPCVNTSVNYVLGNANSFVTGGFTYPDIYGNFYEGSIHQILYKAADLQAQGIKAGTITKIAFDVAQINGTNQYCGFNISMGCVGSLPALTTWVSGLQTVFNPKTVTIAVGWNTYVLDNSYDWDGVSDLVVQVCSNNNTCSASYTLNSPTYYTATAYNSVIYYRQDFDPNFCTDALGLPPTSTSNQRPNTTFSVCQQTLPAGSAISWLPTVGVSNPNIANPKAQVFHNTTYQVNVTANGCVGSALVNVYNNNSLSVAAGNDTSICLSSPLTYIATTIGTPSPIKLNCGANNTACGGVTTQYTLGTAASISNVVTPFNGADEEAHAQYLYHANELTAAGISRGTIKSMAFNVSNKSSTSAFKALTIKMTCTAIDTMTKNFVTGLTTVYGPIDVSTIAGWNTFTFANPYSWDGSSNLLVEVCFTNPVLSPPGAADIVSVTPTGFRSSLDTSQSFVAQGGCNILSGYTNTFRPDTRFNICPPPPGVFTYTWTPIFGTGPTLTGDTITITPTSDVYYQVQVTDSSCYVFDTVKVHFLNGYSANLAGSNIGCNGNNTGNISSAPTQGSGPYTFVWTDSTGTVLRNHTGLTDTLKNLAPGLYKVALTDANTCQAKDSIRLTVPPPLKVDSLVKVNPGCYLDSNGTAAVYVSGGTPGYKYFWSTNDSALAIGHLPAGLYLVHITDSTGCALDTSVSLLQPGPITYQLDSTPIKCFGGSTGTATITVLSGGSGNFGYQWSNGQTTAKDTALALGVYYVTLSDLNGTCKKTDSVSIGQNPLFVITISNVKAANCYNTTDGNAMADVQLDTVNYTFRWDDGETISFAKQLPPGLRTVTVTDTLGCVETDTVTIGSHPRFSLNINQIGTLKCFGDSNGLATVSVVAGAGVKPFSYLWTPTLQSGDTAGHLFANIKYNVAVTDSNGCVEQTNITLSQPDSLQLTGGAIPATCFGGSDGKVYVTPTGGTPAYIYTWNNGASTDTLFNLFQGTYAVTVVDANGCQAQLGNISVTQPKDPVQLKSLNVVNVSCPGNNDGAIFVVATGGVPGYTYALNHGKAQLDGIFNPLKPDSNYVVTLTDTNGCHIDTTVIVTQPDSFSVRFVPATDTIKLGDSIILQPVVTPFGTNDRYTWDPTHNINCDTCTQVMAKPVVTTVYELNVARATPGNNECVRTSRVEVVVINNKILYVPNAFSPNGDGVNDLFQISAPGAISLKVNIFDQWGEEVYAWDGDMTASWDGTFKGQYLPPSVYAYYVEVTYLDKQKRISKGSVTIIK